MASRRKIFLDDQSYAEHIKKVSEEKPANVPEVKDRFFVQPLESEAKAVREGKALAEWLKANAKAVAERVQARKDETAAGITAREWLERNNRAIVNGPAIDYDAFGRPPVPRMPVAEPDDFDRAFKSLMNAPITIDPDGTREVRATVRCSKCNLEAQQTTRMDLGKNIVSTVFCEFCGLRRVVIPEPSTQTFVRFVWCRVCGGQAKQTRNSVKKQNGSEETFTTICERCGAETIEGFE